MTSFFLFPFLWAGPVTDVAVGDKSGERGRLLPASPTSCGVPGRVLFRLCLRLADCRAGCCCVLNNLRHFLVQYFSSGLFVFGTNGMEHPAQGLGGNEADV